MTALFSTLGSLCLDWCYSLWLFSCQKLNWLHWTIGYFSLCYFVLEFDYSIIWKYCGTFTTNWFLVCLSMFSTLHSALNRVKERIIIWPQIEPVMRSMTFWQLHFWDTDRTLALLCIMRYLLHLVCYIASFTHSFLNWNELFLLLVQWYFFHWNKMMMAMDVQLPLSTQSQLEFAQEWYIIII